MIAPLKNNEGESGDHVDPLEELLKIKKRCVQIQKYLIDIDRSIARLATVLCDDENSQL